MSTWEPWCNIYVRFNKPSKGHGLFIWILRHGRLGRLPFPQASNGECVFHLCSLNHGFHLLLFIVSVAFYCEVGTKPEQQQWTEFFYIDVKWHFEGVFPLRLTNFVSVCVCVCARACSYANISKMCLLHCWDMKVLRPLPKNNFFIFF